MWNVVIFPPDLHDSFTFPLNIVETYSHLVEISRTALLASDKLSHSLTFILSYNRNNNESSHKKRRKEEIFKWKVRPEGCEGRMYRMRGESKWGNIAMHRLKQQWLAPLRVSIHPDKMSGPLLPQTAMGGWLALPGKGSLWCAIESRLKASPPQCPLFRSFPSYVLSLIHWILAN